ncbi:SDR family NAD(P)-dependent oxidoreductase [Corticibacterium sp. UT-5YL-CI-8]|nr:SDR family NAD(P)-dependent oxidoreductase [Tianweitania sp. UT-5YL-CI-8]
MNIYLKGRRAVVAGASRGLGFATAMAFAKAGAAVSICARDEANLNAAHEALAAVGGHVHSARCDLGEAASIDGYIAAAAEDLGGIDVLVNNATGQASGNTDQDWSKCFAIDLMGTVRATRTAKPFLVASGQGRVINVSSRTSFAPSPQTQPYGAAKAALIQLTTSQAAEMARHGVRVNCIAPGSSEFPGGWWEKCRTRKPALYESTLASFPFGRFGNQEDIAGVMLFLASDLGTWVTGQTILVDGGQTLGV